MLRHRPTILLQLMLALSAGCGDSASLGGLHENPPPEVPPGPKEGGVAVSIGVEAQGVLPDTMVSLLVDGKQESLLLAPTGSNSLALTLDPGSHQVALADVDANCIADGPGAFTVPLEQPLALRIRCRGVGAVANLRYAVVRNGTIWIGEGDSLRALGPGSQVAWAPDGRHLAVVVDRGIVLRDADGQETPELIYPSDGAVLENLTWGAPGTPLVFNLCPLNSGGCATVVSLERGPTAWTTRGIGGGGRDPSWSPEGSKLAAGIYNHVVVRTRSGVMSEAITYPGHAGPVWAPAFAPDGKRLVAVHFPAGGDNEELWVHDLTTKTDISNAIDGPWGLKRVTWLPTNKDLILTAQDPYTQSEGSYGRVCLFWISPSGGRQRRFLPCDGEYASFSLRPPVPTP